MAEMRVDVKVVKMVATSVCEMVASKVACLDQPRVDW